MKTRITNVLEGTLKFINLWDKPVILETAEGDVDILPMICKFFGDNNGKKARDFMGRDIFSIKIFGDNEEGRKIEYIRETNGDEVLSFGLALNGNHWTNMRHYLETTLTGLIGRKTVFELDDTTITIKVDGFDDDVPTVYYTHGNSATLPKNYTAQEICKPGTSDCCVFLSLDGDGFGCEKFNSYSARHILDKHSRGDMNATRLGNCKCGGRWEELRKIVKESKSEITEN